MSWGFVPIPGIHYAADDYPTFPRNVSLDNEEGKMSGFTYQSSRCTSHLNLRYVRRSGSIYSVLLEIDGKPMVRFEPNGLGQLADWLRNNADELEGMNQANIGPEGPTLGENAQ